MNNKIAIITGVGMDSKTLAHILLSKDYHVILTYRRNTQLVLENLRELFIDDLKNYPNSRLTFEFCDIADKNSVEELIKKCLTYGEINELYMLAAMSHVMDSFKQKEYCILTNGQSYYFFLETLKNLSPKTKVYGAMTSELAGGVPNGELFNEETKWNPRSPYAIGKNLGANWIKFYRESKDSNLFCCFGILFNHSNCYRSLDFLIRKTTNTAAKIAIGKAKELRLGHLDWARDEHWSDFGCEMMWKMLQNPQPVDYVIGSGETHYGEEYVDLAFSYFNLNWKDYVKFDNSLLRPNEVVRLISDPAKAKNELGWRPNRMSFKNHIELMAKYDYHLESDKNPKHPDVFKMFP